MNKPMTFAAIRAMTGASCQVTEIVRKLTAPARHAGRVESAMRAALEYAASGAWRGAEPGTIDAMIKAVDAGKIGEDLPRPNCVLSGDCWALGAAAHCAIEAWVGVGEGPACAGGPGRCTDRAPWARVLGKGRARASDGAAWNAALADASVRLAIAAGGPRGIITLEPTGGGLRACVPGASTLIYFDSHEQAYAICLRGLVEALPAEAPHQLDPLDPECSLRFEGALDKWARTLDVIGEAGAAEYLPDEIPEGDRPWDYVPGIFVPWVDRVIAARLESSKQESADTLTAAEPAA
jgi:hypothetical protein